jgi:hypothetical protein
VSQPFPPTALRRRHAQTLKDRASSYKIDYIIVIKNFLNPEGHQNRISGSKVTAILVKGWILPIGGASAGEGLPCSLRSRLVYYQSRVNCNILYYVKKQQKILPCQPHKINLALERCSRVFVLLSATVERLSVPVWVS